MPPLTIKYKAVHCTKHEAQGPKRNIFHCDVMEGGAARCDVMKEAAGVACGPIPTHLPTRKIRYVPWITKKYFSVKICFETLGQNYSGATKKAGKAKAWWSFNGRSNCNGDYANAVKHHNTKTTVFFFIYWITFHYKEFLSAAIGKKKLKLKLSWNAMWITTNCKNEHFNI